MSLERLAAACLLPGFDGVVVPDWVRRRLDGGLGGVVLYAWNVESAEQLASLTGELRAERADVIVAIPVVIFFLLVQRKIAFGLTAGAVKA